MSPLLLLVDHSQLPGRVNTLYSFAPAEKAVAAQAPTPANSERNAQIKSLIAGTLMFVPFFAAYLAVCASR